MSIHIPLLLVSLIDLMHQQFLPIPFHANIYSTKTAPANKLANHPDTAVTTGFSEFLKHAFLTL